MIIISLYLTFSRIGIVDILHVILRESILTFSGGYFYEDIPVLISRTLIGVLGIKALELGGMRRGMFTLQIAFIRAPKFVERGS